MSPERTINNSQKANRFHKLASTAIASQLTQDTTLPYSVNSEYKK